eukprot:TRINITY_DN21440_c0_g1_i1.p1 TRINITY_DN21440_c0_g1~~TRINITY_DN21440_c0_g1_i1.p1  ORF type:complete len:364 (+),score=149.10 TRINITY_DN21440_c0_g1_i1:76-1092(+)
MAALLESPALGRLLSGPPELVRFLFTNDHSALYLAPATAGYFVYVTLGALSPRLHEHAFTGDADKPVLQRLREGCPVMIPKETYKQFYFPAFFKYWTTFRVHTLGAGLWLLTGYYNLRNTPKLGRLAGGKLGYVGSALHRSSGLLYVLSGFAKGITVPLMSAYSDSLQAAVRWPLALLGVWDVVTLGVAVYQITVKRNVKEHRRWMIRNFCIGAGSIWVRVFGAAWAACDLSFMKDPKFFGQMNGLVLMGGFYYGTLFGEWWVAATPARKRALELAMHAVCAIVAVLGRRLYTKRAAEKRAAHSALRGAQQRIAPAEAHSPRSRNPRSPRGTERPTRG